MEAPDFQSGEHGFSSRAEKCEAEELRFSAGFGAGAKALSGKDEILVARLEKPRSPDFQSGAST